MSNTYLDELLAETASNEVALAMSRDQKTSVNALQKLAYIDNELVLAAIAGHKAAGENLLTTLAQSSFQQVRARVAANLNTLPTILSKFVADTDLEVLKSLANHPKLTEESMVQLAKTENIVVKQFLARNPNCSTSLLAQLIKT